MSHQFGMAQPFVCWLKQPGYQAFQVFGCWSVRGEVDRLVGVHHDVGVGIDDGTVHVSEGGGAMEHLVSQNTK